MTTLQSMNPMGGAQQVKKPRGEAGPSAILHVRNLPHDCVEYELRSIIPPQFPIVKVFIVQGKGQAFIQMQDVNMATSLIRLFERQPPSIRNKTVYFQYSHRTELGDNASSALPPTPHMVGGIGMPGLAGGPGTVLHASILDCPYPITIELIYSVFSFHGPIIKIILLTKNAPSSVVALVQFADATHAANARMALHNRHLYEGFGLIKVQTSTLPQLQVKYNNERSRDFTQNLPYSAEGAPMAQHQPYAMASAHSSVNPMIPGAAYMPPPGAAMAGMMHPDMMMGGSPVVLVNKLNEERTTCDILFNLFGVYGDVQRVKILHNKRSTAMVQFTNSQQAALAVRMLNGVTLFGNQLSVVISQHSQIKLPRPDSEEASLNNTKSYTGSEFHRFAIAGSKNYNNIAPPSATLHLSNIPPSPDGTEEALRQLFSSVGTVVNFSFFTNNTKMALLQMASVAEAVEALVLFHQYQLGPNRLRVSFSKSGFKEAHQHTQQGQAAQAQPQATSPAAQQ